MSANLGKIAITIGGDHIISNEYERLTIVKSSTDVWYLALWDVPANIPLTDQGYWVLFFDTAMNSQQISDNAQDIVTIFQTIDTINTTLNGKANAHTHPYVPTTDVSVGSTTDTAANKIAKRDGAGDIHARFFRMQYDSRNASCNLFATLVDTGSNNYIRTSTVAQVKAKLGVKEPKSYITATKGIVGNVRTFYVYPPSGYTMSHLKGFTAVPIYRFENYDYAGNLDINMYYYYESTRVRVTTSSYMKKSSYMAVWIK